MPLRYVASTSFGPGAICREVIIAWLNDPLWYLRPREGMVENRHFQRPEDAQPLPFSGGEDELLANAKRSPVLIISSRAEVLGGGIRSGVRVIPIHRRADKPYYNANWADIVAGRKAGLVALPDGRPNYPMEEGVLDLRETHLIPKHLLPAAASFALDRASLVAVITAMGTLESLALR